MNALLPLLAGLGTGLALIVAIGVQNTYLLRLAVTASVRVVAASVVVCAVSDAVLILAGVLGVGVVVERFPVAVVVIRFVGAAFLLAYGALAAKRALRPSGDAMRVEQAADDDGVPAPAAAPAGQTRTSIPAPSATAPSTTAPSTTAPSATAPSTSATSASATSPTAEPAGRTGVAPPGRGGVTTRPAAPTMRAAVLTMLVFTWANPHVYLDTLVFLGSVANQQGVDDRWWWTVGAVAASCLWFGALGFGGRLLRPLFTRPLTWRVFDGLVAVVMLSFGVALAVGA
ncbi:L-lysine exporter family protein LysE/ArgO [Curtobacterium sp. AG1037]|uniref:LysE/ArgO family amino acid transporter n=1 Tax=Curtobacterium sp. AG1037 TaxID=2183990 RepID=UPI000E2AD40D|nr:LysE family transporter [Curtobacterium sp. AG1037]RDI01112.1 L-lysine exporter family protein LysE/ArgO [Curtobacterium sp. AG1037]